MTAHLGSKGISLFGSHTTPFKVSIERENFKAIQVEDLTKLSANKVLEKMILSLKLWHNIHLSNKIWHKSRFKINFVIK